MEKIVVSEHTKSADFLSRLVRDIDRLQTTHEEQMSKRLFEENVMPAVVRHLEDLVSNNSLMERDSTHEETIYLGNHGVSVNGYKWKGYHSYQYPYLREINLYRNILQQATNRITIPSLITVCDRANGYSRRKTAKVFLLNFPEFKPIADIKCQIPSISPGNWYRNQYLNGYTREQIKDMQDELQSVLSLLLL